MSKESTVTEIPTLETTASVENIKEAVTEENEPDYRIERLNFDREKYDVERRESRKRMYLLFTFMFAFSILMFASMTNPGIYKIDKETLILINQAFNAIVLLVIPFFLGSLGATARILMAGVKAGQQGVLIVSSGLMAMFSWVGIKSGVLLAIVAPHLEKQGITADVTVQTESNFYTMALVAIVVGMFSTNLYIFINQRVEQIVAQKSPNKKINKD
ncbi:hypothetical protein [Photobacterium phosphoreum]|uniref:hypothetical protein n=1 Tax=Photobacterium phosphoreum TaxID=659 RepID=UPI0024B7CE2B|nr:hypothetical protein [Photobacterium phosphoreum]